MGQKVSSTQMVALYLEKYYSEGIPNIITKKITFVKCFLKSKIIETI